MDDKIYWTTIGIIIGALINVVGFFITNFFLKKKEFKLGWEKLKIESLKELYGLMVELNEQNRKLFESKTDIRHVKLKEKLVNWIHAFANARIFYIKNKIVFNKQINKKLDKSIGDLMQLAVELQNEKFKLIDLERQAGGDITKLYNNLDDEISEIIDIIICLTKDQNLNYIIDSIDGITNDIEKEFRASIP